MPMLYHIMVINVIIRTKKMTPHESVLTALVIMSKKGTNKFHSSYNIKTRI